MRWAPALLIALVLAGCGGSSSSPSSSTTGASVASSTTPTSTTTMSTSSTSSTSKTTTASSAVTASKTVAAVSTAPPPTPAGTPAAPAGLSQTTGYSTYENCAVHCSGAVPASLRRPLSFPATSGSSCPTGTAPGPITPKLSTSLHVSPFLGSKWDGAEVTWAAPAGFSGPILIRGRQLGGAGAIGFGEGHVPYDELQLYASPGKAHSWPTFVRVRGPGCYAFNIDTTHKTEAFVFDAAK
jgi:hypothetical protein